MKAKYKLTTLVKYKGADETSHLYGEINGVIHTADGVKYQVESSTGLTITEGEIICAYKRIGGGKKKTNKTRSTSRTTNTTTDDTAGTTATVQ